MNTTEHVTNKGQGTTRIPNRLIDEKSPYLLQHAYNPVKWYPWGDEAFTKAKEENKPVFLSIGYSTCHWCHVMAHESFEDEEVARYLNDHFISIKVDKEERPDVDSIYMSVCQKLTGSGGWPLTIIMFPNQKPFFAGTYFPKEAKYYTPGLLELLETVIDKWNNNREGLLHSSESITEALKLEYEEEDFSGKITNDLINNAVKSLSQNFEKRYGGFGNAPKFPTPHNLLFLLRIAHQNKNKEALEIVEKTLQSMYQGGIFDHIGYGFSRYSTDSKWLVPHFEKMLYDNALLVMTYVEAYQLTKKNLYKEIAEMTLEYVARELTSESGGFYCAQDADSEGVEGKFYVFTPDEVMKVLGNEDGNYFNNFYGITPEGNFEGKNIPNRLHVNQKELSQEESLENTRITKLRKQIYEYRLERTKLHKDDKVLTSWNALMIVAYAKAYRTLKKEEYLTAAKKADHFIQEKLCQGDQLFVHFREDEAKGNGHIDDYAFYIWSLLELYEATFDMAYLERGIHFLNVMIAQFFDEKEGGFYLYAKDSEPLIHRPKEIYDGAIPSGNSVAAYVLQKIAAFTGNIEILRKAEQQLTFIAGRIGNYPSAYCFSMMAILLMLYPTKELICVAENSPDIKELQDYLSKHYLPNVTVLLKTEENKARLEKIAEYTGSYESRDKKTTFYLCENNTCLAPFHGLMELE